MSAAALSGFDRNRIASNQRPHTLPKLVHGRHTKTLHTILVDTNTHQNRSRYKNEIRTDMPRRHTGTRILQKRTRFPSTAMRYANAFFPLVSFPAPPCCLLQVRMAFPESKESWPPSFGGRRARCMFRVFLHPVYQIWPRPARNAGNGKGFRTNRGPFALNFCTNA